VNPGLVTETPATGATKLNVTAIPSLTTAPVESVTNALRIVVNVPS